ncbi:hypothetical protein AB0B12_11715 [Streptomyces sp. NPDC044780]|uniref:hypothetical protein n=1 Tax=unclassified Streptomyces TaxID=2593676 RepID=UPI0033DA1CC7
MRDHTTHTTTGTARATRTTRARRTRAAAALACATAVALLATACNDDAAQDAGGSESPAATQKPSASASKGADKADKTDKAVDSDTGKTLALGETTALTYKRSNKVATLEIATKSVQKGSPADLADLNMDADAKAMQPYYVTMSFKNIGDQALHYPFLSTPMALRDSQGNPGKVLITSGDAVPQCEDEDPDDFAVGASTTLCKIVLLPKGQTPSVALYNGDFDKEPVYWKATQS